MDMENPPIRFGPFIRHLAEAPTLANILQMLNPSTLDEKMAIAEGYILLNQHHAGT